MLLGGVSASLEVCVGSFSAFAMLLPGSSGRHFGHFGVASELCDALLHTDRTTVRQGSRIVEGPFQAPEGSETGRPHSGTRQSRLAELRSALWQLGCLPGVVIDGSKQ